jgi:hypothetical protein
MTCNTRSWSEGGSVPLRRMAFSCLGPSACCSSKVNRRRCWTTVLTVFCCKLNMYCAYSEVKTLWVGHDLKTLLPHGILLLMNREECDRHRDSVVEAALIEGGEGDVCCMLDSLIQLDADNSCSPWLYQAEGYHHANLTPVLTMGHRHVTTVNRNVPVVAEVDECIIQHAWKLWAMLAHGAKAPILNDGVVRVVFLVHLKMEP